MRPDTIRQLSELFDAMADLLSREAWTMEQQHWSDDSRENIEQALQMAMQMIVLDDVSRDDAAEAAALAHKVTPTAVNAALLMREKQSMRARLGLARQKRKQGEPIRRIADRLNIPKSTLHGRLTAPASGNEHAKSRARLSPPDREQA